LCRDLTIECEKYKDESIYNKRWAEQLQLENSQKYRLNERDDWKSLVESVQADRGRLQEECMRLEVELDAHKLEVATLQKEIVYLKSIIESKESGHGDDPAISEQSSRGVDYVPSMSESSPPVAAHTSSDSVAVKMLNMELEKLRNQVQYIL
jgi:hypothetical protein